MDPIHQGTGFFVLCYLYVVSQIDDQSLAWGLLIQTIRERGGSCGKLPTRTGKVWT